MKGAFALAIMGRTPTPNCPDFPAKSLILFADTFYIGVRGHHCPEGHREVSANRLIARWLLPRTLLSAHPSAAERTDTLSLYREGVLSALSAREKDKTLSRKKQGGRRHEPVARGRSR